MKVRSGMHPASRGLLLVCLASLAAPSHSRKLAVGPGKAYSKPSAAAQIAADGDTVELDAGVYEGDAATWRADNLVIRAGSRFAHLKSNGVHVQGKAIWVIAGKNTTVENIEFSGARVPDGNGAGIRQEGTDVTIRNCFFHDNENGILTNGGDSDILIEYTEFASNGKGDGFTHNMYIGEVSSFTLRHSYSHHAKIGHNVKSRALKNIILYNRIIDGAEGTTSYSIDLPNGGFSIVMGNAIQQGPRGDNPQLIAYGAEGLKHASKEIHVVSNTLVNDRSGGTFLSLAAGTLKAKAANNIFAGPGTPISGSADTAGNVVTRNPGFLDQAAYDYRLTAASPAIDMGKDAGSAGGMELKPVFHYLSPFASEPRPVKGLLDAGAFELGANSSAKPGIGYGRPARARWLAAPLFQDGSPAGWKWRLEAAASALDRNSLGRAVGISRETQGFKQFQRTR